MSTIARGLVKELGGYTEIGTGLALLGTAAVLAASTAALPIIGAVALVGLATFAITDGAMTMLDGMGDVVEGTFDFEVPTLNAYDVVASKMGEGASVGLGVSRIGLGFADFAYLADAMDNNDVPGVRIQVLSLALDVTSTGLSVSDSITAHRYVPVE